MASKRARRAFISFDYDHDERLKNLLVGQSRNKNTPFTITDWSIKEASPIWRSEARRRISRVELVIVICGYRTHQAVGVAHEVAIARDVGTPFYLLRGHKYGWVRRPRGTSFLSEPLHEWTWNNLRTMTTLVR